ncbi:MAG: M28 family peptidase, partial [Polyangia bacterium]|nr:M28 family peptidase [Polyangia bacterium]
MTTEPFSAEQLYGFIEKQVALGARRPGSDAGHASERMLEGMLRGFGLESVRSEPIPITRWEAGESRLEVASPGGAFQPVDSYPIPYVAFTGPQGVEGPLVFADRRTLFHRGARRAWRGAVVVTEIGFPPLPLGLLLRLARGLYDPHGTAGQVSHPATWVRLGWHLYGEAVRAGAKGFIGVLSDQPGGSARMYAPYGFKEKDIMEKPLPAFWVGREAGSSLVGLARSGGARARLLLRGVREPGVTHNIVGEIPPREPSPGGKGAEEVMVLSCHHDSPFASPVEDASGVAVVLGLARRLAKEPLAKRRLYVVLTAGHFYGSIGTRTFIREHPEVVGRTAVGVTIEHIGKEAVEDTSGRLAPTGLPEATGIFVPFSDAVRDIV